MNNVKLWTFTLFACSMLAAIFEALIPSSQKKQLTYVLQMFFLLCLIAPAAGLTAKMPDFDLKSLQTPPVEVVDTDEILNDLFRTQFEQLISDKLEMLGIFPREIGIDFSVSDNAVEVTGVLIILEPEDEQRLTETQNTMEKFLGMDVQTDVYKEVK